MRHSLAGFLFDPVDALPLRLFEIAFTLSFMLRMGRNMVNWREWLTSWGYHPTDLQIEALGFPHPLPLLESWMVPLYAFALFGSGMAVVFQWHRRPAIWVLFVCAIYAQGADHLGAFSYNRIFIAGYALLATAPGPFPGALGRLVVPAATVRILQATLVTLYFAAGVAKAFHGDWLKHSDVLWAQVQGFHRNDLAAFLLRILPKGGWTAMQHGALAFEIGAPVLFGVPRLRPIAIVLGVGFHFMIAALMQGLVFFSLQMWTFYVLFIESNQWRAFGAALRHRLAMMYGLERSAEPEQPVIALSKAPEEARVQDLGR